MSYIWDNSVNATRVGGPASSVALLVAAAAMLADSAAATAAEAAAQAGEAAKGSQDGPVEEVVVTGRYYDAAARLVEQRKENSAVTNILGGDAISRVGDTNVATALRRISGLTLVNDQFVYVRGLGERYSSTTLNGAKVPSVDLSRNVIPLDLFPTFVVDSLEVQKSYTVDQPAAFGGGNVDIRTRSLPGRLVFGVEVGSSYNSETGGHVLSYSGGNDDIWGTDDGTRDLSSDLVAAINRYRGTIATQDILSAERAQVDPGTTLAEAQAINRDLALMLYRDVSVKQKDTTPDVDVKGYLGSIFPLGDDWELGFLLAGAYENRWRESTSLSRNIRFPEERTDRQQESTFNVDITGNANIGLRYTDDHEVNFSSLYLRNTDDKTAIRDFFNENRERSSGTGFQDIREKYEEREITVNQWRGTHRFGLATKDLVERLIPEKYVDWIPDDLEFDWFYSDSDAETHIPNELTVALAGPADPTRGVVTDLAVRTVSNAADFRFTKLHDRVDDEGWKVVLPLKIGDSSLSLSGGYRFTRQFRTYEQTQLTLGLFGVGDQALLGEPLSTVFSDEAITDPSNNFELQRSGANTESYLAATMTDAWFGSMDWLLWDTWRVAAGLRWEQYRQVALDWNPYGFDVTNPVVTTDPATLAFNSYLKDDLYPSVSLTWISGWLAETFQLRFGYSRTVTRPDLREITASSYVDPLTNDLVFGNPGVVPAELDNYDVRAEWFAQNGDNYTVSLFYKDISDPIEFFESPSSDTNIAREIINAESAEVYGVELETLKELGFLGQWAEPFYAQANLTFQHSELVAGPNASAPTHNKRDMTNAAPFVANIQLGYDAPSGKRAATLTYNVFGERLYVAGRLGAPDGFEQPFHSVDLTYSWYPMESVDVQAKVQNLLGESIEIKRGGVTTFERDAGRTFALKVRWDF